MEIILIIGFAALIALNAYASRQCYRDILSSRGQRLAQVAFIWVVPVFGAVLALRLLRHEPEQSTGSYREEPNMGEQFATTGRLNSHGYISPPDDNFHPIGGGDASPN
ncbi:MAG: hypothetical protein ACYCY7_05665 [Gallionella sp.]